jgi:hypothetical protein
MLDDATEQQQSGQEGQEGCDGGVMISWVFSTAWLPGLPGLRMPERAKEEMLYRVPVLVSDTA